MYTTYTSTENRPMRRLSRLPPGEREIVWRRLRAVPAAALAEGWRRWELDEIIAAHARKLGVRLTAAQMGLLLSGR